jgi:hypothetical protein
MFTNSTSGRDDKKPLNYVLNGFDFAYYQYGYQYHTHRDNMDSLGKGGIQHGK